MTDSHITEPMIPVWWNRFRILGSIGLAAIVSGVGLAIAEAQASDDLDIVAGVAMIIVGASVVLLSAAMWYRSRTEI